VKARLHVVHGGFTLDLDLAVEPGRTLALLGPNGAGKSTALAALAGLVISTGSITVGDRVLDDLPAEKRRIGYVFQDYLLFPHLSVLQNVAFGSTRELALEWLDRIGIAELASKRPREISGGQAQRVALARALASQPELLLLDEPLAALDAEVRDAVRQELAGHLRDWGGLTIVVTQRATVRDLVREPATAYVRKLVAAWSED
jgi:molybdate transport system ATP-binding protein